jgi:CARDB
MAMSLRSRGTLFCALALVCALPTAAAAAATPSAKVADCQVADSADDSFAVFEGRMRAAAGTANMAMRFTLEERFAGPDFETVKVPDLAVWRKAQAGVRTFTYKQRVRGLERGGEYRVRIDFRWTGAKGKVLRNARRHSGVCGNTGPLPNLRILAIGARPGGASGTWDYNVDVTNSGNLTAEKVPVDLRVDSATLDQREIRALAPGETATVRFSGPACIDRVRAKVDPQQAIHESNEDDNGLSLRCSALSAASLFRR